jgi:hypothetical protein
MNEALQLLTTRVVRRIQQELMTLATAVTIDRRSFRPDREPLFGHLRTIRLLGYR